MSGDDINKAKGHPSSSLRDRSTVSRSLSSHPPKAPWWQICHSSEERPNVSICSSHFENAGLTVGRKQREDPWDPIVAFMFVFLGLSL